jgi:ribosome-binding ATPase
MKIGIIGLPQSGKSTVFAALTGTGNKVDDFSHQGKESHLGSIKVPDKRIDKLAQIIKPKKIVESEIKLIDEANPQRDKYKCFSAPEIREVDALVDVIRFFGEVEALHPEDASFLKRDLTQLEDELILADLEMIQKRLDRIEKELKAGRKEHEREYDILKRSKESLEKEEPLRNLDFDEGDESIISGFALLSKKPLMILVNIDESKINKPLSKDFKQIIDKKKLTAIKFCAKLEAEISELNEAEQKEFLQGLGIEESARDKFIKTAYSVLNLISFFTVKNDILKSWTISGQTEAPEAAGKIHSDMQRGFIKAEVVDYETFIKMGSFSECSKSNALRLEGKDYLVKDGDIIDFKFSV